MNAKELADQVLAAVQTLIGKHMTPVLETLSALNERIDGKDGAPRVGSETRARNVALMFCIQT